MKHRFAIEMISFVFILLFVYTAMSKLMQWQQFAFVLSEMPLFKSVSIQIALGLPVAELTVAILLLIPKIRKYGLYASLALMVMFTSYLGYMVVFVPHLPCTCGGVLSSLTWKQHIVFNICLIALSAVACTLVTTKNNSTVLLQ